jgi:hypothetical protein
MNASYLPRYEFPETDTLKLLLAVPDYSQLDTAFGFGEEQARHMCGVVSVKALSDYYNDKFEIPSHDITTLIEAYNHGGNIEGAIKNSLQVDLLKAQGLTAWRRNWNAVGSDPRWLVDHEGYGPDQFAAVEEQQHAESLFRDKRAQAQLAIVTSLEQNHPVIASVRAGFHLNHGDHHIVLTGIDYEKADEARLIVMDPFRDPTESGYLVVSFDRFFDYFNYRAIFAKPAN